MRVLRRRATAMSPREKHLALLSALGIFTVVFYFFPTFLYVALILGVCCVACYYHSGEPVPARLGLNPRARVNVSGALRRWLWGWGETGVSVSVRGRATRSSSNRVEGHLRQRLGETEVYRREALASDSFLFSPRDFLMGSYIGKTESPPAEPGRPRVVRNSRELLRERLARPNHAVYTPNRRLSFTSEPLGSASRFTITPQRHYPLQQPGTSPVGVLPPVKWDSFRKKNILSPRNFPAAISPVTVKIARPDHSTPSVDHMSCARPANSPADPCSRESVLGVLKESRKREVEDEDRSFTNEQKSKRRRNDSGGSSHSAFERLLPNGTPSQLVPKPGSLKRGMISLAEESTLKRSRTSSISSGSGAHASRGTLGSRRNAIQSSYSSSLGLNQWKKPSTTSSPLSSPGSSRSQTPEGVAKRAREDDLQSPSFASSVRSDQVFSDKGPTASKVTPVPKVPVTTSAESSGSGGKRKRKIQLVSSNRDDQISMPPPPELGYTITVKDIDEEKKAALSKIQKVLETPEPEKSVSLPTVTSTQPLSSSSSTTTTTLSSLLAAPLSTASSSASPVINLDPSPNSSSSPPAAPNTLLEALKMKISSSSSSTSAPTTTTVSASTTLVQPSGSNLKASLTVEPPKLPSSSQSQSSSVGVQQSSAFAQVLLGQVSTASSSTPPVSGAGLFGLAKPISLPTASSASNPATVTVTSVSNTNPLPSSGFKPIFAVTTTTSSATSASESKPAIPNFKPIFGDATQNFGFGQAPSLTATNPASTAASATSTSTIFGASTGSTTVAPSVFPGLTNTSVGMASSGSASTSQSAIQPAVKPPFGKWPTPSTTASSGTMQVPNTGSTFQFGTATTTTVVAVATPAVATTTTSSVNSTFTFGGAQPNTQSVSQTPFAFGQTSANQNTTTASFGGFAMASTASTTAPTTTTQSTFTFGKPAFEAQTAQSAFGSAIATPKPFTFGGSGASSTSASNPAPAPFTFGVTPATTTATFGTPAKPAFGAGTTGFTFGDTTTPSAAPSFGAATQTQSAPTATFTFGSPTPQPAPTGPAQPANSGFNFSASMPVSQFGTPVSSNPAPQMGSFNFGAASADKPAFGPVPFGTPGTPAQGFNPSPFGSPGAPSFSIGAGSKPAGARQRLQARRQHVRKK
ncbi:nuclear envelope pore membrane protein POM 121 [Pholidichthys leucotaenia]